MLTKNCQARSPQFWAIIVAAGIGQRMQADRPKQYLSIAGVTVIEYALQSFLKMALVQQVVVVINQHDPYWHRLAISRHPKIITAIGGQERLDSCLQGLLALQPSAHENDWVIEHDGVRPCLTAQELSHFVAKLSVDTVGGLLAHPITATIKRGDETQCVLATVERTNLWQAATPQMFRYGLLQQALTRAKAQAKLITDSASAIELMGYRPKLIACTPSNIKITVAADLQLAAYFLESL